MLHKRWSEDEMRKEPDFLSFLGPPCTLPRKPHLTFRKVGKCIEILMPL